jgi:hypothetical protein
MPEPTDVSIRGLQEGFEATPLRKFRGKLDSYAPEPASGYEGWRVNLNFSNVEVLQSTEPYPYPVAVINIGLSNRKRSKWGYFAQSLAALIPETEDIKDQVGKTLGMVFCDGQEGRPEPKPIYNREAGGEVPTPVWVVFEVEGRTAETASGKSVQDIAMEILNGKTLAQFNQEILQRPEVRANPDFQRSILDKSFVTALVQTGQFTVDENGVYHRVA